MKFSKKVKRMLGVAIFAASLGVTMQVAFAEEISTESFNGDQEIIVTRDLNKDPLTEEEKQLVKELKTMDLQAGIGIEKYTTKAAMYYNNGGVNFTYGSSSAKTSMKNGLYAGYIASGVTSIILGKVSKAASISTPAACASFVGKVASAWLKKNLKHCYDNVRGHSNTTATTGFTLTEVRWSTKYHKNW